MTMPEDKLSLDDIMNDLEQFYKFTLGLNRLPPKSALSPTEAKAAIKAYMYQEFMELIGEDEHLEGDHKEKSYDTYINVYKTELRTKASALYRNN